MNIKIRLAGLTVRLRLEYPETAEFFAPYANQNEDSSADVSVTADDRLRYAAPVEDTSPAFQEYSLLVASASRYLLRHERVVYHGVAVKINGRAWLITAPSGTGKTTQYRLLKELFDDKVALICGDKPVLELQNGESVFVHPSPWPGKERFPGGPGGRLSGVVLLEQADHNEMRRLGIREAVFPLFREFLYSPDTETEARTVGRIAEAMLRQPVWKLENRGDAASARLLYEAVTNHENI